MAYTDTPGVRNSSGENTVNAKPAVDENQTAKAEAVLLSNPRSKRGEYTTGMKHVSGGHWMKVGGE